MFINQPIRLSRKLNPYFDDFTTMFTNNEKTELKISDYNNSIFDKPIVASSNIIDPTFIPFLITLDYSNNSYKRIVIQAVIYANNTNNCIQTFLNYVYFGEARTRDEIKKSIIPFTYYDYFKEHSLFVDNIFSIDNIKSNICIHPDYLNKPNPKFRLYNTPKYRMFILKIKQKKCEFNFIIKTEHVENIYKIVDTFITNEINTDLPNKEHHLIFNMDVLMKSVFYESHFETPDDYPINGVVDFELVY